MVKNLSKRIGLAVLICSACLSQTPEKQSLSPQTKDGPEKFYHLSFVVQELDNERVINTRSYSGMMADGSGHVSIRAGEKVPFASSSGASTLNQLIDIGVSIDCHHIEEAKGEAALDVKAEISSIMETQGENRPPSSPPIIRNNQWEARIELPMKQSAIIFSSDDPASKHKMQLLLTVTPTAR